MKKSHKKIKIESVILSYGVICVNEWQQITPYGFHAYSAWNVD